MKTAIVHDWLTGIGGSEVVLKTIYELYPSPIYTLIADKKKLKHTVFEHTKIVTSFIQNLPLSVKYYRKLLFLFPIAIEQFDLSEYELIISSSHAVAKGVIVRPYQLHICYCHTPMRYIWDLYHQYLNTTGLNRGLKGLIAKLLIHYLRIWDISTINRIDYFIANSNYIANRIKKIYRREAEIIYPPVDINSFSVNEKKDNYFLTASRLVPYKRIDLIVSAFTKMPDKKLIVIGEGPEMSKIKKIATKNIFLLGYQPFDILHQHLRNAKAFIYAAEEDFGILPVEAQACGTPVIGYARGGLLETVTEGKSGIFFYKQTQEEIINTVHRFEKIEDKFDAYEIRKGVDKFSIQNFKKNFKKYIEDKTKNRFKN